ncbi:MAG TPA: S-layer homology domain-containing protein [Chloroflexia bacterium]|nr:S-layer homology domain-containing protein [Chloroflexia bacterium]
MHITWGDCRNDPQNNFYDWYYATTTDGSSFDGPLRLSSVSSSGSFDPGVAPAIGDYSVNYSINGTVYATWTDTRNASSRSTDVYAIRGTYEQVDPTPTPPGPTPTPCVPNPDYTITRFPNATIVPAHNFITSCDDCVVRVPLPFNYKLYDQTFSEVIVGDNGTLGFEANGNHYDNSCLTTPSMDYAILPHWDTLYTTNTMGECPNCGIYTSVSGTEPNRIFNILWDTCQRNPYSKASDPEGDLCGQNGNARIKFEVRLYEGQTQFDIIYDTAQYNGYGATIGVQKDTGSLWTGYPCNVSPPGGIQHTRLNFSLLPPCPTATPTPTACSFDRNYAVQASPNATMIPGATDTGNHCDDCTTWMNLPFGYSFYDEMRYWVNVSSNGNLQFGGSVDDPFLPGQPQECQLLPVTHFDDTIFAYWGDLKTEGTYNGVNLGIYTSISRIDSPNSNDRIFNIEWRACRYEINNDKGSGPGRGECNEYVNFVVRLYEGQTKFDIIYGNVTSGSNVVVGTQQFGQDQAPQTAMYTPYSCNQPDSIKSGTKLTFTQPVACPTRTPTRTKTPTRTPTKTYTPTATETPTNTPTPTACSFGCGHFADVPPTSDFAPYTSCLACANIATGYPCDNTPGSLEPCNNCDNPYFRPYANVTRKQIAKMVDKAAGFSELQTNQVFEDISSYHSEYVHINRLANRGVMSGYPCGEVPEEPCDPPENRPYFRPGNNATRGQISKIVSNARGFNETIPGQFFEDVPPGSTFYDWIQRLAWRGIVGGYLCGGTPQEPCVTPNNRPYFRAGNNATRGQAVKIIVNAFNNIGSPGPLTCPIPTPTPGGRPMVTVTVPPLPTNTLIPGITPGATLTVQPPPQGTPTEQATNTPLPIPEPWPTIPLPIPSVQVPIPVPSSQATVPVPTVLKR